MIRLDLPPALRDSVTLETMRRIERGVAGKAQTDSRIRDWKDLLNGYTTPSGNSRWPGSCELSYPMVLNQYLTVKAQCATVIRRSVLVMVESVTGDEDAVREAEDIEAFLSAKMSQIDATTKLLEAISLALSRPTGIVAVYWDERFRPQRGVQVVDPETGDLLPEDAEPEGEDWERQHYVDKANVEFQGVEIKPVPLENFYMFPASALSIDAANGCGERMWLTQDDLIAGIENYGYDEDAVYELIHRYPDGVQMSSETNQDREDEYNGVPSEGLYECFLWYFHPPVIFDGEKVDKGIKPYLQDDFEMVCCPAARIELRLEFSDDPTGRRYIPIYMEPVSGNFYGMCLPDELEDLACEANATVRHAGDCKDIQVTPMTKVKKSVINDMATVQWQPGGQIPVNDMGDIEAFQSPQTWTEDLTWLANLDQTAERLVSAGGFGTMQSKQRKAAEVESVQRMAASKFDLILTNLFGGTKHGITKIAIKMLDLYEKFMDDGGETFTDDTHHSHSVSPKSLSGKFTFTPVVNGMTASPETRAQMAEAQHKMASAYLAVLAKAGQPGGPTPQILSLEWENTRKSLIDMGEHDPERRIGKQPEVPPAQPGPQGATPGLPAPQIMQQLQAAAQ